MTQILPYTTHFLLYHLKKQFELYSESILKRHNTKLLRLWKQQRFKSPDCLLNLSSKKLTLVEENALRCGLKHHILPQKLDADAVKLSIEKVVYSAIRDTGITVDHEFRDNVKFCTQSFLSNSKSLCSSKVNQTLHRTLSLLAKDKTIKICKYDKGTGTVILNSNDYFDKMDQIVNDTSKFQQVEVFENKDHPVIKKENSVSYYIRKYLKPVVSEETANNLMPTGSQCGKLYGLCKVHKSNFPMRPVVSMIGTPEYQLAKYLDNLIKPNIPDTYMLTSTKNFIDRINSTNVKPNDIMVSFDVCSLFTNVPLAETIDIITEYCFSNQAKLIPPVDKKIFKKLLKLATGGLFMYNGRLYKQIDGVAMGSPLGPTIANFFLANLEMEMFKKTNLIKPTVYLRYVDDVFAVFDCNETLVNFFNFINKLHPNLKFTLERANDTLPFLDVEVKIIGDYFETCVYRKKTHTNVLLNYNAMVPKKWKIGLILCLLNRAWCICSTSELFTTETAKLRKMFFDNNYPIRLFNQILEKFMANRNVVTEKIDEVSFRFILKIPYVGQPSFQFQKKNGYFV